MPKRRSTFYTIALLVAACSPAPPPSVSQAPTASASPSATASPTPSATGAAELTAGAGALPPGTYTRSGFHPPIILELGEGWFAGTLDNGFFDVQQEQGTPDVVAVQFARVKGLVGADGVVSRASTAVEATKAIRRNPGLAAIDASESRLGGMTGSNLVVENTSGTHAPILDVSVGRIGIDSGRRLWISLFDTDDGLLAVMVGGSVATWQHALDVAEPVLESVVIGGSPPAAASP